MKKVHVLLIFLVVLFNCCSSSNSTINLVIGDQVIETSDRVKLAVKVAGKGQVCIYLHGGPGQDYLSFEKMGGAGLEKCMTMVYLDQRGSGHSGNASNYSLDRVVQDIEEVRLKLGVEKVYLLSHSFGGILAIKYASKYPEHLLGVILANTTAHFMNTESMKTQIEYGYKLLKKDTVIQETNLKAMMRQMTVVRKKLSAAHLGYKFIANDINTIIKMDSIENSYKRTSDFGMALFLPLLDSTKVQQYPEYFKNYALLSKDIITPVLIITGKEDHSVGPDYYKNYTFKQQKVVEINGSHMLYYENNKTFITAVCDFVK